MTVAAVWFIELAWTIKGNPKDTSSSSYVTMNKQRYTSSFTNWGVQRNFWSVFISIISSSKSSLGIWTLKENNSVSSESILSVQTPIVRLKSCIEFG